MRKLFLIASVGLLLASCANEQTTEQKEANLMEISRNWSKAASAEEFLSFINSDGIMMAPDKGSIQGHGGIKKALQEFQSIPGFAITWEPQEAFVSKSGDLGYSVEKILVTFDGENGEKVKLFEKGVSIWKKNKNGEWKMAVDIWNVDPTLTSIYK
ncbi:hypothetical protein D1818_17675 [Aquimarina sp. BL5]|uniref:YybH family protein n=1 Tax=Aquimarina sp. BL5 TaxID=1714860 RepID=UPI000E4DAB92|nr:DUF4440 domain-containing protein [Aquimarina sp. BL5]AXT52572.1 hypothetical protein D1818_17675 [Aquimarina sp. BL5]RKN11242.1 hypothetical protein D7036_01120 [Aquimarina sp. BL5]